MANGDFVINGSVLKKYVGTGGDVVIPDGITEIGSYAFDGCKNVTSVVIPYGVTVIGTSAFGYCFELTSVTIPGSVVEIEDEAFLGCKKLTSVVIPVSVKNIGRGAFEGCRELKSVTLPVKLKNIGLRAFDGFTGAFIREDVANASARGFSAPRTSTPPISNPSKTATTTTSSYTSKPVAPVPKPVSNTPASKPSSNVTIKASSDFEIEGTVLKKYKGSSDHIDIPYGVTSIGAEAFTMNTQIKSVTIPETVTSIGSRAFAQCISLTSITSGNSVTSIGEMAFSTCVSLTSITMPNSIKSIGFAAFIGCLALKCVAVPPSATIGFDAFPEGCTVIKGAAGNTAPTSSSSTPKHPASAPITSSSGVTAKTPSAPVRASSSTSSSGNDFLSQVRKNSVENSPENVLRRKAEAKAQKEDKKRRDTESAISIEFVDVVKKEILHYAPYYWYTNQNGQRECAGEIVLSGSGSSGWSSDRTRIYAWIGYPTVSVNWYGEPRMNKSEMPIIDRPKLDYYAKKAQGEREALIKEVFNPAVECIKKEYGVIFKKYEFSHVVHGETLFEKLFLCKMKDALGSAVSIVPCAPEIQATYPSNVHNIRDLKMNRVYKFKFVF